MAKTIGDITAELSERVLGPAKAEAEKLRAGASAEAGLAGCAARSAAATRSTVTRVLRRFDVSMVSLRPRK